MLNTNLILIVLILFILLLIFSKIKLTSWKFYKHLVIFLFIIINVFVLLCFIVNYIYAYKLYTLEVLESA